MQRVDPIVGPPARSSAQRGPQLFADQVHHGRKLTAVRTHLCEPCDNDLIISEDGFAVDDGLAGEAELRFAHSGICRVLRGGLASGEGLADREPMFRLLVLDLVEHRGGVVDCPPVLVASGGVSHV